MTDGRARVSSHVSRTPHSPTEHPQPMPRLDSTEEPNSRPNYATRSQSWLKHHTARPDLRRHSSLADIAREHKNIQKQSNDIRKFYGDEGDRPSDCNWESNKDIFVRTHRPRSGEATDYLLHYQELQSSLQSSLPENSNFIYRTGSQLFSSSHKDLDLNIFSCPSASHSPRDISRTTSHTASAIPSRTGSNTASRTASRVHSRSGSISSSRNISSDEDNTDEEGVLFVGRKLRKGPREYDGEDSSDDDDEQPPPKKSRSKLEKLGSFVIVDLLGLDPDAPVTLEKKQAQRERYSSVLDPALMLAFAAAYLI